MSATPFIAAAYGLFAAAALTLVVGARLRLRRADARLRTLDPRAAGRDPA